MSDLIRHEEAIEAMEKSEWGYLWECEQVINVARTLPSAEPERKKGDNLRQAMIDRIFGGSVPCTAMSYFQRLNETEKNFMRSVEDVAQT